MAEPSISEFISDQRIDRIHDLMDHGLKNITDDDMKFIEHLFDLVTTAIHLQVSLKFVTTMDEQIAKTLKQLALLH